MGIEAEDLNNEEAIDLESLANAEDNGEDNGNNEEIQLTDTEQKAYDQGWRPQGDFNGPEDNWKTAREYVRDGEFLATIKGLSQKIDNQAKEFDSRLENTNKLHEHRRLKEISDLKATQREAVDDRDTNAYDKAQGQIDELEKEPVKDEPKQVTIDPVIDAWETENAWIHDPKDERSSDAKAFWNSYLAQNPEASNTEILTHVDKKIAQFYPAKPNNPRRDQPNTNETPARRSSKGGKSLSMGDLTSTEKNEYQQFGSMFKDEKSFLKAVSDTRAAS